MTTELEKQFFSTFGIKKRLISPCKHLVQNMYCDEDDICRDTCFNPFPNCVGYADCREDYKRKDERYPTITDRHYLELYCTLCDAFNILHVDQHPAFTFRVKDFKECVLKDLIGIEEFYKNKHIKHQVQAIFKGGN